jgi:putative endonuclease
VTHRIERYKKGHWAEYLGTWFLRLKAYHIKERRFKTKYGEIDLIAVRGNVIVFVEVKARDTKIQGLEAITPQAQQRIMRAAQAFMQKHRQYQNYVWRFDALVVRPWRLPYHVENAWRL